jgi:Transposase
VYEPVRVACVGGGVRNRCARERTAPRTWLGDFCAWCAITSGEVHRLAATIDAWWPQTLRFRQTGLTNARTEGANRVIKDVGAGAVGSGIPPTTAAPRKTWAFCPMPGVVGSVMLGLSGNRCEDRRHEDSTLFYTRPRG